jgi:2-hydroxychromene-2-carboxylate isomerase
MSDRQLEFFFEFASTYSYPAAARIEAFASRANVSITWRPFLLGPIFHDLGWDDSPFNLQAAKGRYMWRDLERCCTRDGIPLRKPSHFPRNGLLAARVACVGAEEPWCPAFVRAVYRANFAEDRDISSPELIAAILESLDLDAPRILASAATPEAKTTLRDQTARAVKLGVFGAPTFITDGELFWGNDRLEDALGWKAHG